MSLVRARDDNVVLRGVDGRGVSAGEASLRSKDRYSNHLKCD